MLRKNKGSITIEAALIVPLITAMLIVLIFFSILSYSRVTTSVVINETANKISATWNSIDGEFSKLKNPGQSKVFYMYFSSDKDNAKSKIEEYIKNEITKRLPMKPSISTSVTSSNCIIAESFNLTVECGYNFPLGALFELVGIDSKVVDKYNKGIMVSDSNENMRTIRYGKGLAERLGIADSFMTKFNSVMDKIRDKFNEYK